MNTRFNFAPSLKVAVVPVEGREPAGEMESMLDNTFGSDDELSCLMSPAEADLQRFDLAVFTQPCGYTPLARTAAASGVPCFALHPYGGFHPYQAVFNRDVDQGGGRRLPASLTGEIQASVSAVRACKALRGVTLIVAASGRRPDEASRLKAFQAVCRHRFGIKIDIRTTQELQQRSESVSEAEADAELQRWYQTSLEGPGEMGQAYMRQVARLGLAERAMLDEEGAIGITPDDIKGFLTLADPMIMPNITYGPLTADGFLVCEEADIEVLVTELLLYAGFGTHPTMSNIYFAYRDRLDALTDWRDYTAEMEAEDCRQCFNDNHITLSHFGSAGVLPPEMMEESRYKVRETVPAWPGQGMISSTPKLGPVMLARIASDGTLMHLIPGEADGLGFGDRYGWYRGRWFVKIPDAYAFARNCLHQHYAVARDSGNRLQGTILFRNLLGMTVVS